MSPNIREIALTLTELGIVPTYQGFMRACMKGLITKDELMEARAQFAAQAGVKPEDFSRMLAGSVTWSTGR